MWIQFELVFWDGTDEWKRAWCIWIPSNTLFICIKLKVELFFNRDTEEVTADLTVTHRRGLEHFQDDQPEHV